MNHNFSLWCLLSKYSRNHNWNKPSWWPDRPLLRGVHHIASRYNGYHTSSKMYMMLPFLYRKTSGNRTIQGRDRYHNNSSSCYTKFFGFHRWNSRSSDILAQKRKWTTVVRHWITFLVKSNFATFFTSAPAKTNRNFSCDCPKFPTTPSLMTNTNNTGTKHYILPISGMDITCANNGWVISRLLNTTLNHLKGKHGYGL